MKSKNYLISGVIFYIFLIVGSISFGFSEPPLRVPLEPGIETTIKQGTNEDIKETDEKTLLRSILIISVLLVLIIIIVILFKIWWDS